MSVARAEHRLRIFASSASLARDAISQAVRCDIARKFASNVCVQTKPAYRCPYHDLPEDADVEEFDKNFPPKEKLKLPGQLFE